MRLSRPCYDKPHRCPGWAGGGVAYAQWNRCENGSIRHIGRRAGVSLGFGRCNTCDVITLPYALRWLDRRWLSWYFQRWEVAPSAIRRFIRRFALLRPEGPKADALRLVNRTARRLRLNLIGHTSDRDFVRSLATLLQEMTPQEQQEVLDAVFAKVAPQVNAPDLILEMALANQASPAVNTHLIDETLRLLEDEPTRNGAVYAMQAITGKDMHVDPRDYVRIVEAVERTMVTNETSGPGSHAWADRALRATIIENVVDRVGWPQNSPVLARACHSPFPDVRYAASKNPSTPTEDAVVAALTTNEADLSPF